ncbi:MAG: MipA/OmpV family protein [Pseudomonadota bacterium]
MKTLLALSLAVACGAACAQTPATNPMPDGSRDMYVGLGVVVAPDYPGAREKRVNALPLLQLEWSNGMFLSGMSAGMHLSRRPDLEFGPLLALDPGRDQDGSGNKVGGATPVQSFLAGREARVGQGLEGLRDVHARLQLGAFANLYLTPSLRLSNSFLYGAGHERNGVVWNLGLQHISDGLSPRHRFAVSAGINLVNRNYNASYFGVTAEESVLSGYSAYAPNGGLRDIYVGAGWNWALSPSWMIASTARVTRLRGDARHSPLVERPANFSISSGLVFRF